MSCFGHNNEAEEAFDETFEKVRNLDFSEFQDKEETIDKLFEMLETPAEFVAFFKDSLVNYKFDTSLEECFKNGVRVGKEFFVLKKSSTKVRWSNSGKSLKKS